MDLRGSDPNAIDPDHPGRRHGRAARLVLRVLDLLDALESNVRIIYVPREPEALAETSATAAVTTIRMTDEIEHLLSQLDQREAEVLKIRFGLDRGEPRTLQEVADHFDLNPSRIAQIEKRALTASVQRPADGRSAECFQNTARKGHGSFKRGHRRLGAQPRRGGRRIDRRLTPTVDASRGCGPERARDGVRRSCRACAAWLVVEIGGALIVTHAVGSCTTT